MNIKQMLASVALLLTIVFAQAQDGKKDILGKWNVSKIDFIDKHGQEADESLTYEKGERTYTFKKSKVTFVWSEKHAGQMKEVMDYSIKDGILNMDHANNIQISFGTNKRTLVFREISLDDQSVTVTTLER